VIKQPSCIKCSNLVIETCISKHFNIRSHFRWWWPCLAPTFKQQTIGLFSCEKKYKEKMMFLGSKIEENKLCIANKIQVDYQVATFGLLSTPCLDQINISLLMLPFLLWT